MSPDHGNTRRLLEAYIDAALSAEVAPEAPSPPLTPQGPATLPVTRWRQFRVGPFRFLLPAAAVQDGSGDGAVRVSGLALVPARYRTRVGTPIPGGPDALLLKGGRVAIVDCLATGELDVADDALQSRGLRPDTPWIAGTLVSPPCFVLDSVALQLHFGRRGGAI